MRSPAILPLPTPRLIAVIVACNVLISGSRLMADEVAVIQSYAGPPPASSRELLEPVINELVRLGYPPPKQLAASVLKKMSRPGLIDAAEVEQAQQLAAQGYQAWLQGSFGAAADQMKQAIALFERNPAAFAADPDLRPKLLRARVFLALSYKRLGNYDESLATMATVVRGFPDIGVSRGNYGPEAYDLYRAVKRDIQALNPGELRINASEDNVTLFVNERFVGTGAGYHDRLPPGQYRIYAQRGSKVGRLHVVDVAPDTETSVSIDWDLDAALTTDAFFGLTFPDEATRAALEAQKAVAIARAANMHGVIVLALREYAGRMSVVGSVLSLDSGKPKRVAAVAVEPSPPSAQVLRGLARFLAGGDPVPGLILPHHQLHRPPANAKPGPRDQPARPSRLKWAALAGGVIFLAAGGTLIYLNGPIYDQNGNHTPEQRDTLVPGLISAGGGIALLGTALVLWLRDPNKTAHTSIAIRPLRNAGFTVSFAGLF